jgi:hypothetical protein
MRRNEKSRSDPVPPLMNVFASLRRRFIEWDGDVEKMLSLANS